MKKNVITIAAAVLAAAVVLYTIAGQITLRSRLAKSQAQMELFMGQTREELGYMNETQELIKQNAQQVRQYVNLPSLAFPERETRQGDGQDLSSSTSSFEIAAYDAVAFLKDYNRDLEYIKQFNQFLRSDEFTLFLQDSDLSLRKMGDFKRSLVDGSGREFFKIRFKGEDSQLSVESGIFGSSRDFSITQEDMIPYLKNQLEKQNLSLGIIADMNIQLQNLYRNRDFRADLRKFELYLGTPAYSSENLRVPVLRKDNSVLAVLTTHTPGGVFRFQNRDFTDISSLKEGVLSFIQTEDLRTEAEILDDLVLKEMETLLNDQAFQAHLEKNGYVYSSETREDNDYIYYDLNSPDGSRAGALALQKEFGEVYLMDRDDIPVSSLKTFAPDHELVYPFQNNQEKSFDESLPVPVQGSETFLLIGSHEHNADTMIIVHFNSVTEEVSMLSVPRDLYYKGMKINSIYRNYGASRLISDLSAITGLNINKYMAIDMYAFIDMVNLMGGINVTLDEPLIDPTYKIRENGQWSTLYYSAGEHHLDGVAALRITRSRHTSSDFERAVRQQKVIAALRDSLSNISLGDISKIYDFMQIADKYLISNFSTAELVKYYLSYKDYKINGQNVLNTDNVLYATYTNLYRLSEEDQEKALADPDFYKGGWIVLPKNNDWSAIRNYVRAVMMSS